MISNNCDNDFVDNDDDRHNKSGDRNVVVIFFTLITTCFLTVTAATGMTFGLQKIVCRQALRIS